MSSRHMTSMRALLLGASLVACLTTTALEAQPLRASHGETSNTIRLSGWLESEIRIFPEAGLYDAQRRLYPALGGELRLAVALDQREHRWTLTGFGRVDGHDRQRSHLELREASWTWQPANWQVRAGMLMAFWGVTESNRLVDVVNQRDQREAPAMDAKLGQPGIAWAGPAAGGTLEIFALTYHRPLAFGLGNGRFRVPPNFVAAPVYESAAGRRRVDWAGRWSRRARALDLGLSYFSGTSREPEFLLDSAPQPRYAVVNQAGLDAQLTLGALLLKAEAISREEDRHTIAAMTTGAEYVLGNAADSGGDITVFHGAHPRRASRRDADRSRSRRLSSRPMGSQRRGGDGTDDWWIGRYGAWRQCRPSGGKSPLGYQLASGWGGISDRSATRAGVRLPATARQLRTCRHRSALLSSKPEPRQGRSHA